jgi:flagellar hook protein FlgE
MMPAMESAISGLEAHQTMLNVTANNLANVDTIGFKADSTTFESELSQLVNDGSGQTASNAGTNPEQSGLGVQVGAIEQEMTAGAPQQTGNALDVSIQGDGFFVVGNSTTAPANPPVGFTTPVSVASGNPAFQIASTGNGAANNNAALPTTDQYTQAGNFNTNAQGYLTTSSGQYVLGFTAPPAAGAAPAPTPNTYIYIPPGSSNVSIGQTGQVTYTDANGQSDTAGYLALASFPNETGLTADADTEWSTSANSGAATFGTAGVPGTAFNQTSTISGELEQSNVDMATEFTNMIEAERGYQANSSVIQTADTLEQTLIQMAQP